MEELQNHPSENCVGRKREGMTIRSHPVTKKQGSQLLEYLKEYDNESQIIGPTFVDCSVYYKGISKKDAPDVRNYLRVKYADSAEIVETGPTSSGEYTFTIISNNEDSKACRTDLNIFAQAKTSTNISIGGDETYSYVVKTNATDALRYYLTRNNKSNDLQSNGLTRLDVNPPPLPADKQ